MKILILAAMLSFGSTVVTPPPPEPITWKKKKSIFHQKGSIKRIEQIKFKSVKKRYGNCKSCYP